MQPIRLVFYGTSSFAVPALDALAKDARFSVVAVVTQPDRPVGRHAELQASAVKQAAIRLNIPIHQFEKVRSDEAFFILKDIPSDVAVVASFGQIIPQRVLDLYPHSMINVHGSLLPNYRGASPIAAAIKAGDKETGITIMKMDALMDHGPTLAFAHEPINADDTASTLEARLAIIGAKTLPDALFDYVNGKIQPEEQNHSKATTVKLLRREDGEIDWTKPADEIERTVRAYTPWPGTFMILDGKRLKILRVRIGSDKGYPTRICGDGIAIQLVSVQPEGKSVMDGKSFLAGHREWR